VAIVVKRLIGLALRVLVMLPLAPSVYALCKVGVYCISDPSDWACQNLVSVALDAPFFAVFGPLAHDEEPPVTLWPEVLLTAALLAVVWWAICRFLIRFPPSSSASER
jgi:hypothetical protein